MQVKCKFCSFYEDGFCRAKKSGGKHKMKANSNRSCDSFEVSVIELSKDADKEYNKRAIPRMAPTWRYYSSKKELKELGEENGPLYIRTNPDVKRTR